eukprot:Anaeramoba_ignava/a92726_170.p1 GENE.a92726_170~~a92726_170.p1  ORF type:complete len:414 (+),score=141.06 a92726_170:26-1243(+)
MVLEGTLICIDNSEYMRNSDFSPTRFEAQLDSVNIITGRKTNSNFENTVGVLSMGGSQPKLVIAPTSDVGKILASLHEVQIAGDSDHVTSLYIAQLALKHRMNRQQAQRIIMFVGSPVKASSEDLLRVGNMLKKNNVALDIVNFGETDSNREKLDALIETVNKNDNSHIVHIPPISGVILSDQIQGSLILGDANPSDFSNDFGVDPNIDPELALALRLSLEENARRNDSQSTPKPQSSDSNEQPQEMEDDSEYDEETRRAIEMSLAEFSGDDNSETNDDENQNQEQEQQQMQEEKQDQVNISELNEDEQMKLILERSINESQDKSNEEKDKEKQTESNQNQDNQFDSAFDLGNVLQNQDLIDSVLLSLPGVNPNDDRIKSALESLKKDGDKKDDEKKEDEKEKIN